MLDLPQIKNFYPQNLHHFPGFLLREYLQYKILALLFRSSFADRFAFLGGTCLRIVHQSNRFSEDLDFDNFGLTHADFEQTAKSIRLGLEREGYQVEMENVYKGAYHCYIKFPNLLRESGLSGHREAKILIQLDTEPQGFDFQPEVFLLNKFDVFGNIRTTPIDLLLSQKISAFCQRKRAKGRDLYDITFLNARTKPHYGFLKKELGIENAEALKTSLFARLEMLDLPALAADVAPFLFYPEDEQRVRLFPEFVAQAQF